MLVFLVSVDHLADETLGQRIHRLREAHGMTRPELEAAMRARGARTQAHEIRHCEIDRGSAPATPPPWATGNPLLVRLG